MGAMARGKPTSMARVRPTRELVARHRLLDRLVRRFEIRLTMVIGGAGSGKTTLLAQALDAPHGHCDVWYGCTSVDRKGERLLAHVRTAVERALGGSSSEGSLKGFDDPIDAVAELVLGAAPQHVCLVLDDVHHLVETEALDALVARLPANGHVLVAGRRRPAIETARLESTGQIEEIDQRVLLLTDDELVAFASLRGVDIDVLESGDRWPAFVEMAAAGMSTTSRDYLQQEALAGMTPERRRQLAAFAFVDGGDEAIARAVAGVSLTRLVDGLPLVRMVDDEAKLHDLWRALLEGELGDDERRAAATAAADVHLSGGKVDRALDLAVSVEVWDVADAIITSACQDSVSGGFNAPQVHRWRDALAASPGQHAIVDLLTALLERETDPTSERAWTAFDRAAQAYNRADDDAMLLIALSQMGYLARIRGDAGLLASVMNRIAALAQRHDSAAPYLAFGEAWQALADGLPDAQLAAMERIRFASLPDLWQHTRDHLAANALTSLGRAEEALRRVPRDIASRRLAIPGALVTESQALWFSGQPDVALARGAAGLAATSGARDRFVSATWLAMMYGFAGNGAGLAEMLELARESVGEQPSTALSAQFTGIQILQMAVAGDEERVARELGALLEAVPLGSGPSEQMLRNINPIAYITVPASRAYWDHEPLSPTAMAARDLARAFVASREGDDSLLRVVPWPEPGLVASTVPVIWAMEIALRGVRCGRPEARQLAQWLCEHWGEGARSCLRTWLQHPQLGGEAQEVLARTPMPPDLPASVQLLGTPQLSIGGAATLDPDWRRERVRALVTFLVLQRQTTRDQAAMALWPDVEPSKANKNLRTTLNYVHGLLEPRRSGGDATWYIRIDGPVISLHDLNVDVWRFEEGLDAAEAAGRQGQPSVALDLMLDALGYWRGDLASELDYPWLDLERVHLRSRFVRASCRAAELLVATERADEAVDVLRSSLRVDRWHHASYVTLSEAYEALGDHTAGRAIAQRQAVLFDD